MILTCQQCGKRYLVKDEMIDPKGRNVRCVACDHTWLQKRPESAEEFSLSESEGLNRPEEEFLDDISFKTSAARFSFSLGWICLMASMILLLSALVIARYSIISVWPPAKQAYQTVGLSVTPPGAGLKIENAVPMYIEESGKTYLIVKGEVVNTSKEVVTIPPVLISLRGDCDRLGWFSRLWSWAMHKGGAENQCILQEWRHPFSENRLFAGERVVFETEPYITVPGATDIVVHF